MMLVELGHFNNAKRHVRPLLVTGSVFAAIGLGLIGAVFADVNVHPISTLFGLPALAYVGAAFLLPAAGFLSSGILTVVRERLFRADLQQRTRLENPFDLAEGRNSAERLKPSSEIHSFATWPPVLVALLLGAVAAAAVMLGWDISTPATIDPGTEQALGAVLLVAAFPLLVLERSYASLSMEMLPEAPQLERLLRAPLTACLGVGASLVLVSLGLPWAIWIERATGALIIIIALELILRSAVMFFIPFAPIEHRRTVADSSAAGLLRFSAPNFRAFNIAVRQQFGIDLSRSWALAFIQRAMLPIVAGMGLAVWGITGITALGLNQRAVYERFGSPVRVFGPGLHVHLPWPMGVMRRVELGVIHDIPIAIPPTGDPEQLSQPSAGVDQQQQLVPAEAPAPFNADRLWNASHPSEQTFLIASEANGQQSFQVADADLRVVYRIGLSDAAALDFAYRVADPENLIRAVAGQLLVRYFSRYTLLDVLGQSREAFATGFRTALQAQLDRMSSGIEAIAVVVEAIHPPPGAAAAYHNVQAAEIFANAQIAVQRATAIRTMKAADQVATEDRNRAVAAATELRNQANSENVLFDADRSAWQRDNQAFLLERRLERLVSGIARSELVIVDHRLNGKNSPTIDLRSFDAMRSSRDTGRPGDLKPSDMEDDDEFVHHNSQPRPGPAR